MSKTIDERVVSMQFDNKQFENNVKTSMSTIDRLKEKLNFKGASKGLENVNAAAKKCDLEPMSKGAEAVRVKFSAMEVIAVTALTNITNSALNAGKRIVSALTIDPVKTGFQEYETQINAVQTILANTQSKGTTLDDVNKALDELNQYADKTIYNFTEMTRNIGTFTAAGIDLDTSVNAIQGIANLAAVSGSTSQQASTAMYQLSQALASGTVKLMDWNSVVNAGMGGQVFQDALKKTSERLKTGAEAAIEAEGSFRESLTTGWLTAEVLTETLKGFTTSGANEYVAEYTGLSAEAVQAALDEAKARHGEADAIKEASKALAEKSGKNAKEIQDALELARTSEDAATKVKTFTQLFDTLKEAAQSGWTQTWELLIGDFEEAKEFFTELSDKFGSFINGISERRNELLGGALNSRWDELTKQVKKAGISVEDFEGKLKETAKENGIAIDDLIKKHGSLASVIAAGKLPTNVIVETLKKFAGEGKNASKSTEDMTEKLEYFQNVVNKVWRGDYSNGVERVEALTKAGYDYQQVQDLVNKTVDGHKLTLEDLSDTQLESIGYTEDQIKAIRELAEQAEKSGTPINELIQDLSKPSGRELLLGSLMNIIEAISKVIRVFRQEWQKMFPPMTSNQLYNIIEAFNKFTQHLIMGDKTTKNLRRTLRGLFAIIDILRTVVGGALKIALKVLGAILGNVNMDILELTAHIGDAIVKFRDWLFEHNLLSKAIVVVVNVIKKAITFVSKWIKAFFELPVVQKNISKFKDSFRETFKNLGEYFSEGGKVISDFIKRVRAMDGFTIENIKAAFKDFKDNVLGYFIDIGGCFDNLKSALKNLKDSISGYLSATLKGFNSFKNTVIKIVDFIKEKFESLNFGTVFGVALLVGLVLFIKKITDILGIFAGGIEGFGDMLASFAGIGLSIKKVFNSLALGLKAIAMKNAAIAIAILVGAVALLTFLDVGKLWGAIGALAAISAILVVVTGAMGFVAKSVGTFGKASLALLAMGAAMLLISVVVKRLSGLSGDTFTDGLIALAALEAMIIALVAVSKLAGQHAAKAGAMMIQISLALLIMIKVVEMAGELDPAGLRRGLGAVLALEALIAVLIAVSALAGKNATKAGSMILKISAALFIMLYAMKIAAKMDAADFKKGIAAISALLALTVALVAVSTFAGKNAAKAGAMILMISVALATMMSVMWLTSRMDASDINRGLKAIVALELLVVALIAISSLAGKNAAKAGLMILEISGALLLMTAAMAVMSMLDPSGLDRAIEAIAKIMAMFAVIILASSLSKSVTGSLIAMTVAITLISGAIIALAVINPSNLTATTAALSGIMAMFAVLVISLKFINTNKGTLLKTIATLATLTIVIGVLGAILLMISGMDPTNAIGAATALSVLLLAISAVMVIIGTVGKFAKGSDLITTLGTLTLIVAGLGAILYLLQGLDPIQAIGIATALSELMLAMSVTTLIVSNIKGGNALSGVMTLIQVVGGIAAFVAAIGGLVTLFPQLKTFVDEGAELLAGVGNAIGGFVGGIIGGFMTGISSSFPQIGQDLSDFMKNLQPFLTGLDNIDAETLGAAESLAGVVLAISAANLLNGIASFITGTSSIDSFSAQLIPFGNAMVQFSSIVSGNIDTDAVEAAANAGSMMASMASDIPNSGGVLGFIMGENDMQAFGNQLVPFGRAMVQFSSIVAGKIDADAVQSAADAGSMMAAMAQDIPNSGGVLGFIMGENDMQAFGNQLVPFGTAMVAFSNVVAGKINKEGVQAAADAGSIMASMAQDIPNSGGVLGFIMGENDMREFGNQLVPFGTAMVAFSQTVKGNIDNSAVESAATAGSIMAEMANKLPSTGGLVGWFVGETISMEDFGNQLVPFGKAMVEFSNTVKNGGLDNGAVEAAASAGTIMAELANKLPKDSGWIGAIFGGQDDLESFGEKLSIFGTKIVEFSNVIKNGQLDRTAMVSSVEVTKEVVDIANTLPDELDFSALHQGLTDLGNAIANFSSIVGGNLDVEALNGAVDAGLKIAEMANIMPEEVDIGRIKNGMSDFATAMVTFSQKVSMKINAVDMMNAAEVGVKIAEMMGKIPDNKVNLTAFGINAVNFGISIKSFSEKALGIDLTPINNAITAGKMVAELCTLIPANVNVLSFTDNAGKLGAAIVDFATKSQNGIDLTSVGNAVTAGKNIASLVQVIPAYVDLTSFNSGIVSLANSIKNFSTTASSGLNTEAVTNACSAGKSIADMTKLIPQYTDFASFNTGIIGLGKAIVSFSASVQNGLSVESVTNACNAGRDIANMTSVIPQYVDFASFNAGIVGLGSSIKAFSSTVRDSVDSGAIIAACNAGRDIANMTSVIPQYVDFASFNSGIVALGQSITGFSINVSGSVNSGAINGACEAGRKIAGLTSVIPQSVAFDSFNSGIVNLADSVATFSSRVMGGVSTDAVMKVRITADNIVEMSQDFNSAKFAEFYSCVGGVGLVMVEFSQRMASISTSELNDITSAFETMVQRFNEVGEQGIDEFVDAFSNQELRIKNAVAVLPDTATGKMDDEKQDLYDSFFSAGAYCVTGFCKGISENTFKAEAKAEAMASAALEAAKDALRENSPSKAFYEIGDFAGIGFVNAFADNEKISYNAGYDMASYATKGLSRAISKVNDVVNLDIDTQPTIRPVLDLSDITSGADRINGMFTMQPSIGVLSNVEAISSTMNGRPLVTNNDVVSAIRDLGRSLGDTPSGDTYQINGITYDDGSNIQSAVKSLVRAARVERRR